MLDLQLLRFVFDLLNGRIAACQLDPDRGDVAEKIVIVGVFVALAIAVGALITTAVTGDATKIATSISGAKG